MKAARLRAQFTLGEWRSLLADAEFRRALRRRQLVLAARLASIVLIEHAAKKPVTVPTVRMLG